MSDLKKQKRVIESPPTVIGFEALADGTGFKEGFEGVGIDPTKPDISKPVDMTVREVNEKDE
jgi:hypothetical protein